MTITLQLTAPHRGNGKYGSGHFGASRGSRKHKGVDLLATPGAIVHAMKPGKVTKLGYAYADDLSYRYVQVLHNDGYSCQYFYVEPGVEKGDMISGGDPLGVCQDLDKRYPGIANHVHIGIKTDDGGYVDPELYFNE